MYKLLVPALALFGALACSAAPPSAAELRSDAAKAEADATLADAEATLATQAAARATAEEERLAREDALAAGVEWQELADDGWNTDWDAFFDSAAARHEGAGYALEREADPNTGAATITVRRVRPVPAKPDAKQDAALQAAVVSRLSTDKDVHSRNIDVRVTNEVVYLTGTVRSKAEAREAVRLALNTRGVYDVVSRLDVKN